MAAVGAVNLSQSVVCLLLPRGGEGGAAGNMDAAAWAPQAAAEQADSMGQNLSEDGSTAALLAQHHVLGFVDLCRDEAAAASIGVVCNHDSPVRLLDFFLGGTLPHAQYQGRRLKS